MAEPGHRMFARCRTALSARRDLAQAAYGASLRAVADAGRVRAVRADALDDAEQAWIADTGHGFDPVRSRLLGRMLLDCAATLAWAEDAERQAETERGAAAARWHAVDGRCRALERRLHQVRRREARRRDEALLGVQADRLCYAWTRR